MSAQTPHATACEAEACQCQEGRRDGSPRCTWPVVLDLRPLDAFCRSHLIRSTHIGGLSELEHRYSSLPPPPPPSEQGPSESGRIELVIADEKDWHIQHKFDKWNVGRWRWIVGPEHAALRDLSVVTAHIASKAAFSLSSTVASRHTATADEEWRSAQKLREVIETACPDSTPAVAMADPRARSILFWKLAEQHGLLTSTAEPHTSCTAASTLRTLPRHLRSAADVPQLMFQPSPIVKRAMTSVAARASAPGDVRRSLARALDLGCGGGRDVAWMCEYACGGLTPGLYWRVTGVDVLTRALARAEMLLVDAGYPPRRGVLDARPDGGTTSAADEERSRSSGVDALFCARIAHKAGLVFGDQGASISGSQRRGKAPLDTFDLILLVRFLPSLDFLCDVHSWLNIGGILAISHFALLTPEESRRVEEAGVAATQEHSSSSNLTRRRSEPRREQRVPEATISCTHSQTTLWATYASPPHAARFSLHHLQLVTESWERSSEQHLTAPNGNSNDESGPSFEVVEHRLEGTEDGRPLRSVMIRRNR